jgi:all-trans-8'-apo-beta-carotenal 15,15'-oxygenase
MIKRRDFLKLVGGTSFALALPGCASSPPLPKSSFIDFGDNEHPYLGLATSLYIEHDYETRIEGKIPESLRGTLYRNGPGLFDRGRLRKRSLLDGDGMVQSFRFHDRGISYRNRFVRTRKYIDEAAAGKYIYPSWSTQAPGGFFANFWAAGRVLSEADITVYLRNDRLYAFDESSLPYELDPENLETIGQSSLGLAKDFSIYSAHSKFDYRTGEWITFGVRYGAKPSIHITIFRSDGALKSHRVIDMPRYVYIHDFFVTEKHVIFNLHPAEIAYWWFLLGLRSMQDSLRWRPENGNHIIVVEREGNGEPLHLSTDARYMWHSINSYENGEEIIADFIGYRNPDHFIGDDPIITAVMTGRKGKHEYPGEICRYIIEPGRKRITQEIFYEGNCEWPRINDINYCHRNRYGYMSKCRAGEFFWSIILRYDFHTGKTSAYDFGAGVYCSEPVLAPFPGTGYISDPVEQGWLLTEVYDSHTRKSYLAILFSERLEDGPLASAHLTHHVPFSYHGFWQERAALSAH